MCQPRPIQSTTLADAKLVTPSLSDTIKKFSFFNEVRYFNKDKLERERQNDVILIE
jgi:hypothetical protein